MANKPQRLTLQLAVDYVRGLRPDKFFLRILQKMKKIFSFTEERHNRMSRYVAVVNAYKNGMPIEDILKNFGCSKRTIYDYLDRAGIPRTRHMHPEDTRKAVLKDYKEKKLKVAAIAKLHGVSRRYVQTEARKAGLKRNKR